MDSLKNITQLESYIAFKTPLSLIISGSSFSGKTTFVTNLIKNKQQMFIPDFVEIIFVYNVWQALYDELEQTITNIKFLNRIPSKSEIDELTSDKQPRLLILDDKMTELSSCPHITELITVYTHHKNLSTILLIQNIFYQGAKCLRDITLNVQGIILFRNKRSALQISNLAKDMFPGSKRLYFLDAYEKATSKPYGYLFIDLSPGSNSLYQLRTNILPEQNTIVYLPTTG